MPYQVNKWPFASNPDAWGMREYAESVYVFGIFEPAKRKNDRFKRIMLVARYFLGAGEVRYEAVNDSMQFTLELKAIARDYGATYPASLEEHQLYLQLMPAQAGFRRQTHERINTLSAL